MKSGLAQKKTSAIADSKKKWMRRIWDINISLFVAEPV